MHNLMKHKLSNELKLILSFLKSKIYYNNILLFYIIILIIDLKIYFKNMTCDINNPYVKK